MSKKLIVSLRPDGSVAAETVGMAGDECLSYISALEDLLDAETAQSSFTDDRGTLRDEAYGAVHDEERR